MSYLHQLLDRVDVELLNDEFTFTVFLLVLGAVLITSARDELGRRKGERRGA
jgi:hypothetical protein